MTRDVRLLVVIRDPVAAYVHCRGCGTEGPAENDELKAIESWNRRYPDETPAPAGPKHLDSDASTMLSGWPRGPVAPAPQAPRRCTRCGEMVKASDLSKQGGEWYHPGRQKAKGQAWVLWCGPVVEDRSAGGGT